jgi:hypothetical protein
MASRVAQSGRPPVVCPSQLGCPQREGTRQVWFLRRRCTAPCLPLAQSTALAPDRATLLNFRIDLDMIREQGCNIWHNSQSAK